MLDKERKKKALGAAYIQPQIYPSSEAKLLKTILGLEKTVSIESTVWLTFVACSVKLRK